MKYIEREAAARDVPDRWAGQYKGTTNREHQAIRARLWAALANPLFSAALVDEIIGNQSWTRIECHECGKDVSEAVELGQPDDYDSYTAVVCVDCLKKALSFAKKARSSI